MKMKGSLAFLLSFLISAAGSYLLLLTGIWYLVAIAGLVASLAVRSRFAVVSVSSFVGGFISPVFIILSLPVSEIMPVLGEVGTIAGIQSSVLLALIFLITALLCLAGSMIGWFFSNFLFRRNQEAPTQT